MSRKKIKELAEAAEAFMQDIRNREEERLLHSQVIAVL